MHALCRQKVCSRHTVTVHCILYQGRCLNASLTVQSLTHKGYNTPPLSHSMSAGIAGTLRGLLGDGDAVVRQRSAHALGLMAGEDWYWKVLLKIPSSQIK